MPPRNLLAILLTAVLSLACYSVASKNRYANLFAEAMDVVNQKALRPIPREQLFVGAMKGMLKDLDEHSIYISGDDFQTFDEQLKQEFGGVGMYVEVDPQTKMLMVLAPMPGTPAFEAGIQVGDLVVAIEGEPTFGKERGEAVKLLRGPVGERVTLDIERHGQRLEKSIERQPIPVESVHGDYRQADGTWRFTLKEHPEIGYIRLSQFGEKSAIEVRSALENMPPGVTGLILDIRANSGGLLDVAVEICDMFLDSSLPIVRTRGRDRKLLEEHFSTPQLAFDPTIPVCILIDRYSASASEILAGCLQDHQRAVLIGEQSYGKGTVQNIIPIQRGQSALKLTTASYWRPSGLNIDRHDEQSQKDGVWGVRPDPSFAIEMELSEVLENLKFRNARDIEGLATGADELLSELRFQGPDSQSNDAPRPDDAAEGSSGASPEAAVEQTAEAGQTEGGPMPPHVDRPLQRAIEFLISLRAKSAVAA